MLNVARDQKEYALEYAMVYCVQHGGAQGESGERGQVGAARNQRQAQADGNESDMLDGAGRQHRFQVRLSIGPKAAQHRRSRTDDKERHSPPGGLRRAA